MLEHSHALLIGISDYTHLVKLTAPVRDAQDLRELLIDPHRCAYAPERVTMLLDQEATRAGILAALDRLAAVSPDATVWIGFSGHGGRLAAGPQQGEYLLPVDANPSSPQSLAATSLSTTELVERLGRIPARKLLLVLDCCHAAGLAQLRSVQGARLDVGLSAQAQAQLASGRGRALLCASRAGEPAYEHAGARNGVFTTHLLAGLRGGAAHRDQLLRVLDLYDYVQRQVTATEPRQHPVLKTELEDNFPVVYCPDPPPPAAAAVSTYPYDVFLHAAERGPDRQFVRKRLRRALAERGIRTYDADDFTLGMPRIKALEQAVQNSRYTVAVLSKDYGHSGLLELGDLMAQHLGTEQRGYRLLALKREPCEPRLGIELLTTLDLSDPEDWDPGIERLVAALRRPLAQEAAPPATPLPAPPPTPGGQAQAPSEGLVPTRSSLRKLLGLVLLSDSMQDAFCLDYFPDVYQQCSGGMDRETKRNLLLLHGDRAEILRRLRESHPKAVRRYEAEIQYEQE